MITDDLTYSQLKGVPQLYLYSEGDRLIPAEEIERFAEIQTALNHDVKLHRFHVRSNSCSRNVLLSDSVKLV
mgnify:CR=1 FL=1